MKSDAQLQLLTNAIVVAGAALLREAGRLFKPHGLTAVQFNVLNLLSDQPAGLRPSAITEALVVEASSTTYVLDRMEELGWLKRAEDEDDRRALRIVLTRAGRELHAKVAPVYVAALREMMGQFEPQNLAPLIESLLGVQAAARAAVDAVLAANAGARRKS